MLCSTCCKASGGIASRCWWCRSSSRCAGGLDVHSEPHDHDDVGLLECVVRQVLYVADENEAYQLLFRGHLQIAQPCLCTCQSSEQVIRTGTSRSFRSILRHRGDMSSSP
eukprot:3688923-Amphidinium_carterae.1